MSRDRPDPDEDPFVCSLCGGPIGEARRIEGADLCGSCGSGPEPVEETPPEYRDVPTIDEDSIAEQYATEGVESRVLDDDGDLVGHVGLFDLDDVALAEAVAVAERLPDPVAILRSSPLSYHVWSLAIDGLDAWLDRAERLDAIDSEHIALSRSRGCMVLRIDAKVALDDGREVRPAPRLRRIVLSTESSPVPCSRPHARILGDEYGATIPVEDREWVGSSAPRRAYLADINGGSE
jgi:hypothetical protein